MPTDPKALAQELTDAYAAKTIVPAPSSREGGIDLDTAYAVEAEIARARRAAGHQTVGWKVRYANKAMWRALKLDTLVWAHMYDDTVHLAAEGAAALSIGSMFSPKIEPEIVFKIAQSEAAAEPGADGSPLLPADVLRSVEWMAIG